MIPKELEAEILRLFHAEKWPVGTIATQVSVHHTTVQRVLTQAGLRPTLTRVRPSIADPFIPYILETLKKYPKLCASRLYEMVEQRGYTGAPDHFRCIVARHRPRPPAQAYLRLRTLVAEQAQVDWGHFGKISIGKAVRTLWAFVMVLSWSRQVFLRFYLSAAMSSFLRGHLDAFAFFGGVPRVLLYDNLKSAVLERVGDAIRFNPRLLELATHYHFEPRPVAVARGNEKGRVERAIRYVRDSFFAARTYTSVEDLNAQAHTWMTGLAADRRLPEDRSRTVRDAFCEERGHLLPLPEAPFSADEITQVSVGKTPYARFDGNDYSVPHTHVRRPLTVAASLETVRILDGATLLASHRRCWDRAQTLEDPSHIQALTTEKARAHQHRATSRLSAAAPSTQRLLARAAERGGNLGNITARLLVTLDHVGADELEAAVAEAIAQDLPSVGAVRQILDRRFADRGLPPPVVPRFARSDRATSTAVRPHDLARYDQLSTHKRGTHETP